MALDPVLVALIGFCRGYHGLSYDESLAVSKKAVEILPAGADEADLFEVLDLVWGASLLAGKIEPGQWNVPVDPRNADQQRMAQFYADSYAANIAPRRAVPVEYNDSAFVIRKPRKKTRRSTPDV